MDYDLVNYLTLAACKVEDGGLVTTPNGASNGVTNYLRKNGHTHALLDDDSAYNVFVTKRENRNYSVFTLVDAYESDKEYGFQVDAAGKSVKFYDAVSGGRECRRCLCGRQGFFLLYASRK